ncbi:hypothetical protein ILYODFUR_026911 [Ilyodon furcidens]|uniref:Fibronectin type-III domain-containing protein n=1 Tax=Ilyodon furcidens TaxID=33524 RepID=A0ABV0V906_9TELE
MQMTSHYYNVTICSFICETLSYPHTNGSSLMSINISNLTAATEYFIQVSAVVDHLDNVTSRKLILQDYPATLTDSHMKLSDIPFLIHRVQYDVGSPFGDITASTLLGRLSTRLRSIFMGIFKHSLWGLWGLDKALYKKLISEVTD